jgi:hypothetical protein
MRLLEGSGVGQALLRLQLIFGVLALSHHDVVSSVLIYTSCRI